MFVLWIAMVVSVWSGVDYYLRVIRILRPTAPAAAVKRVAI